MVDFVDPLSLDSKVTIRGYVGTFVYKGYHPGDPSMCSVSTLRGKNIGWFNRLAITPVAKIATDA